LDICGGFLEKIAIAMWKVHTRSTSASGFFRKLETAKKHQTPLEFLNEQFDIKWEKISRFGQLLLRANPTADQIWLADFSSCAIGVQQQVDNFV
jgi:hypothetical protein